jgi:hypothetical protein
MWKIWKDEMDKAYDYSKKICCQLEIVLHHNARIVQNEFLPNGQLIYCFACPGFFYANLFIKEEI